MYLVQLECFVKTGLWELLRVIGMSATFESGVLISDLIIAAKISSRYWDVVLNAVMLNAKGWSVNAGCPKAIVIKWYRSWFQKIGRFWYKECWWIWEHHLRAAHLHLNCLFVCFDLFWFYCVLFYFCLCLFLFCFLFGGNNLGSNDFQLVGFNINRLDNNWLWFYKICRLACIEEMDMWTYLMGYPWGVEMKLAALIQGNDFYCAWCGDWHVWKRWICGHSLRATSGC